MFNLKVNKELVVLVLPSHVLMIERKGGGGGGVEKEEGRGREKEKKYLLC